MSGVHLGKAKVYKKLTAGSQGKLSGLCSVLLQVVWQRVERSLFSILTSGKKCIRTQTLTDLQALPFSQPKLPSNKHVEGRMVMASEEATKISRVTATLEPNPIPKKPKSFMGAGHSNHTVKSQERSGSISGVNTQWSLRFSFHIMVLIRWMGEEGWYSGLDAPQ